MRRLYVIGREGSRRRDGWLSNQSEEQTFVSFFDRFAFRTAAVAL